jgi:hypothetical protein
LLFSCSSLLPFLSPPNSPCFPYLPSSNFTSQSGARFCIVGTLYSTRPVAQTSHGKQVLSGCFNKNWQVKSKYSEKSLPTVQLCAQMPNDIILDQTWLRRMPPSGMWRRVALVRTDVSEESFAFIIRVTRISEVGTLAVTSNRSTLPGTVNNVWSKNSVFWDAFMPV